MDVSIPCICPAQSDHDDTVTLRDTLDFGSATRIRKSLAFVESDDRDARAAEVLATLTEAYLLFGIERWTVLDERGKPVPLSHSAIRSHLLSRLDVASIVADEADDLYREVILLPLVRGASRSSAPTQTTGSTSQPTGSSSTRRKHSRRSSTSTTPTVVTEVTSASLDGVSSSSPSSESAA